MRIVKSEPWIFRKAEVLTRKTYKSTINSNDSVFIYFHADCCKDPKDYGDEFDKAANEIAKLYPKQQNEKGKIAIMKVNCSNERVLAQMFNIYLYPTFKLIKNGSEIIYGGDPNKDAFVEFIKSFIGDPVHVEEPPQTLSQIKEEKKSENKQKPQKKKKQKRRELMDIQNSQLQYQPSQ